MNNLTLITKPSLKIFNSVFERDFVVFTHQQDNFNAILSSIKNSSNRLLSIVIKSENLISQIEFKKEWRNIPLIFYVKGLGKIRDLWKTINLIKELDIIFFLPAGNTEISTSISFLSSLGIKSGIYFSKNKKPNYEALKDLIYYAFYPRVNIGDIQPFSFIQKNNILTNGLNFSSVYFNNPEKYLWIDINGNIAFTEENMNQKKFLKTPLTELYKIEEDEDYKKELLKWHEHFLKVDKCSACPAWRICKASKEYFCDEDFQDFMTEIVDVASDVQSSKNNKRKEIWQ